ncbi:MAG: ribonuclease Z [Candidatus Omnitrophica bacterium]|nr:ribonuclease Z [Candidatus Omnitrophota bacterium]
MEIIFLGTNGWFDSATGNTICTLIRTKKCNILLDAGYGIAKAGQYLDLQKPTYIFLSHLHIDHVAGLHVLAKFDFKHEVTLFAPKEMIANLNSFFSYPYTIPAQALPFKMRVKAFSKEFKNNDLKAIGRELIHASKCLGYRFELENKIIAYCTDTGICANMFLLAENADVLITECALLQGQDDGGWPHLDPSQAAKTAKQAKAKKLALTHFDAENYPDLKRRKKAQAYAGKIFPDTIAAFDGMRIKI